MTAAELVDEICGQIGTAPSAVLDAATPDTAPGTWIRGAIRSILRFDPTQLAAGYYDSDDELAAALKDEAGALACFALVIFSKEVITHFLVLRHRKSRDIVLRTDADAIETELPNAHVANLITMLAAALHNDEDHRVVVRPARERSAKERRDLREAARGLYRRYSLSRHDKFDQRVDGDRHFGTTRKFRISDRLLHSVAREVDPRLERMPVFVRAIEAGLGRRGMQLFTVSKAS